VKPAEARWPLARHSDSVDAGCGKVLRSEPLRLHSRHSSRNYALGLESTMANSALYFPYIDVPPAQWLFKALLYWDSVKSIVPLEYLHNPERHSHGMRELLLTGLVEPVVPGMYLDNINRFGHAFLSYVDRRRRAAGRSTRGGTRLQGDDFALIHVEKLGGVGEGLVERELAESVGYPWYRVRSWAARAFMAYLAGVLGKIPEIDADPLTSDRGSLALLGGSSSSVYRRRMEARSVLMRRLLPHPVAVLDLHDIVRFKERHSEALCRFRRQIELECIAIAQIEDETLRRDRTSIISEELSEEIGNLSEAMRLQWGKVLLSSLTAVLGAVGGFVLVPTTQVDARIAAGSALAATVYQALDPVRDRQNALRAPLAYGALAWKQFGAA